MSTASKSSATPSVSSRGSRSVSTASFRSSTSADSMPDPYAIEGVKHYARFWYPEEHPFPDRAFHQVSDFIQEVTDDPSVRDLDLVLLGSHLRNGPERCARPDHTYHEGMGKTETVRKLSTALKEMRKALPHAESIGNRGDTRYDVLRRAADAWHRSSYKYRQDKCFDTAYPTPALSDVLEAVLMKRLEKARPSTPVRRALHAGAAYAQSQRRAPAMDPIAAAEQAFGRLRLMRNSARSHAMGLEGPRLLKFRKGPGRARTGSKRSRPNPRKQSRPVKSRRS